MEARSIGFGVAAAVCGVFASIVIYSMERDHRESERAKAIRELTTLESELESAEGRKKRATSRLEEVKSENPPQKTEELQKKMAFLTIELQNAKNLLEEKISQANASKKQKQMVLDQIRSAAVGTVIPQLELSNGQVIKNAKITNFTPMELKISYPGGVSTVDWRFLPEEVIERFEMGPDAEYTSVNDPSVKEQKPDILTPSPPQVSPPQVSEQEIAGRKARLQYAQSQMDRLSSQISSLNSKAAPNPMELKRLNAQRNSLQLSISRMQNNLYNP